MPQTTLFETHLYLDTDYVNQLGNDIDRYDYIKPGSVFTMNYTHTKNYLSEDATVHVTVESVRTVIDDDWPEVCVLGCIVKPAHSIYVCEYGAYLAKGITLLRDTIPIATGHVLKIITPVRPR
jgi:hypothetical protein